MICYNCNTDYPQQPPEPFWICPKCKQRPAPAKPVFGDPVWIRRAIKPEPLNDEELQEMMECGA